MPITIEELKTIFTGDDSAYRVVATRMDSSLSALVAKANAGTASIAGAFNGLTSPINAASSVFTTFGNATSSGFNQIAAASQQASSVMTSSLQDVQAAAGVVPASLAAISTEAGIVGQAVKSNGDLAAASLAPINGAATNAAQGIAGLGSSAVTAGAGVAELSARKAQLMGQLANLTPLIRSETSVLAAAQQATASLGTGQAALNTIVKDSEGVLAGYVAKQSLLKAELATVNTALKGATVAQGASTIATGVAGAATEELGKKTGILSTLFSAHTSQISSQGTAWKGYDNVVQAVIRSMGGIPIVWALAITVGGVLLEKLITMVRAKKDTVEITDKLVESDAALALTLGVLADQGSSVSSAFDKQAQTFRDLLSLDLAGSISAYIVKNQELDSAITTLNHAVEIQKTAQQELNRLTTEGVASNQDYIDHVVPLTVFLGEQTERVDALNVARTAEQSKIDTVIRALSAYQQATGTTTEAILEQVRAAHASEEGLARLAARMDASAVSALNLAHAITAISIAKPAEFDLTATTGGIQKLFDTAADGAAKASAQFQNFGEATIANQKNLKPLNDAIQQYAKYQAAATGITRDKNAVDSIAKAKLKELADASGEVGARVLNQTGLMEAATESTKKMGEAHRGGAGHVRTMAAAIQALDPLLKGLNDAMRSIADGIDNVFRKAQIDVILRDKIAPAVDTLRQKAAALRGEFIIGCGHQEKARTRLKPELHALVSHACFPSLCDSED